MRCHKYSRSFGSIDRVDRWAVWRVLASLLPQTTLPQASPAAQLELDTRARRLRARGVAGNAILGAFRCRSPPSHPTFTPDNPLQTAPFLIARYDDARAKPTHARALRRRRRSLARSIARARCGGGGSVRLHRPSRALRAPRVTRAHAYVITAHRARHHRFPSPSTHACARCALRRRSLARSIARVRCGGGDGGLAVGHAARHTHHALRASRARTCASSTGDTRVITVPFPPRARTPALQRKRRSLAPSIARARCGGKRHPGCLSVPLPPKSPDSPPPTIPSKPPRSSSPGTTMLGQSPLTRAHCGGGGARSLARSRALVVAVEVAFGYTARHARYARRASRARTRTSSPRIARVITVFRSPRARPARARCSGGGAHSRARLRARGVAVVMVMAVAVGHAARDARNARRASRIRTRASSPRVARVIAGSIPPARTRARAAAAALARSLDRAHAVWRWRWRWRSVTSRATRVTHVTRVARHARARAHHHRFARVITVFRPPRARPARARCCGGGARSSLDRSIARTRCGVGDGGGGRLHRASRASRARAHVITAHRARHHRPLPRCQPCARAAFARSLICCCVRRHAAHRTCARDLGALVSATPPCMTPHPLCNTHGTHATHNTTRRRQHDDDDDDPRACRAAAAAAALRSLARSLAARAHVRWRLRWRWRSRPMTRAPLMTRAPCHTHAWGL